MAKLSEQVTQGPSSSRTERLVQEEQRQEQQQRQQQEIDDAKAKLSQAKTQEEYAQIYGNLSPFQKSAFASPSELKAKQEQQRQQDISFLDVKIAEGQAKLQQYQQNLESANTSEQSYTADAELQRQDAYVRALTESRSRLQKGENLGINEIFDYANALSDYAYQRRTSKYASKEYLKKSQSNLNKGSQIPASTFTGVVQEFDVKGKKETLSGTRFFVGGEQVAEKEFSTQYNVVSTPSGTLKVISKPSLTLSQQTEQDKISSLPVSAQPQEKKQKTSFQKLSYGLDFIGDIIGSIAPDTSLSGTRSFEETTVSEAELLERRKNIQDTLVKQTFGSFVFLKKNFKDTILPKIEFLPKETFLLRRDIAKGAEEARNIQEERTFQVSEITKAQEELTSLNDKVNLINTAIDEKKGNLTKPEVENFEKEYSNIEQERLKVFENLASKGVTSQYTVNQETGLTEIKFTSPAIEKDIAPSAVKELRNKTPSQIAFAIGDTISQEIVETGIFGLGLGATGIITKLGTGVSKVPLISKAVTKFPSATKVILLGTTVTGVGVKAYFEGTALEKQFAIEGLPEGEGFFLGAGATLGKAVGFGIGAYSGSKLYTSGIIEKSEAGGFTKPKVVDVEVGGQKVKAPAQAKFGRTIESGGKYASQTKQLEILETKIPNTNIKIEQTGTVKEIITEQDYAGQSKTLSKVVQGQAPVRKGTISETRGFLVRNPLDPEETGIVTFTKKTKGVEIDQFRTRTNIRNIDVLSEDETGAKTLFIDFNRQIEKVGETIFVKRAKLDNLQSLRKYIDVNRLFTKFAGEDTLFSLGRSQQVVQVSPKIPTGIIDTTTGQPETIQTFQSVGSSRTARVDVLKNILKRFGFQTAEDSKEVFGIIKGKRGQVALTSPKPNAPLSPVEVDSSIRDFLRTQGTSSFKIDLLIKDLTPEISKQVSLRNILGGGAISGTPSRISSRGGDSLKLGNLQKEISRLINESSQANSIKQVPSQSSSLLNLNAQLLKELLIQPSPSVQVTPTGNVTIPTSKIPYSFGAFDFFTIEKKLKRKRNGSDNSKRILSYTPDFTSIVADLPALEVSQKDLNKLIKKIQTGAEIRQPVILRK